MKMPLVVALIPLAACGRTGFDVVPDARPAAVLECGRTTTIALADDVINLSAVSTPDGYAIFTTNSARTVDGTPVTLAADDPTHTPKAGEPVTGLATQAVGTIGAVSSADNIVLAVSTGPQADRATATSVIRLSSQLAANGAVEPLDGWTSPSVTYNGQGIAFVAQDSALNLQGSTEAANVPALLVDGKQAPSEPMATAVGGQIALTWIQGPSVTAQLFTPDPAAGLKPVLPAPQTINTVPAGAKEPQMAYAAGADRLVFVWSGKEESTFDSVWFSVRDGRLGEIAHGMIQDHALDPVVVAGDHDFLITWKIDRNGVDALGAARLSFNGDEVTPAAVASTGGSPRGKSLVVHNGQPALIWAERTGDGVRGWIDPLCAP